MTVRDWPQPATLSSIIAELPRRRTLRGPLTTRRLRRSALILGALWVLGGMLALAGQTPSTWALGLGVAIPGGGFLIGGHWLAALSVLALFAVSFAWFFMGNALAPVIVWIVAAAISMWTANHEWESARWLVPLVLCLSAAGGVAAREVTRRIVLRKVEDRKRYLKRRAAVLELRPVTPSRVDARELTDDELAHLRFALDRGLQPMDDFNGLEGVGPDDRLQFFETSLRYQMCQSAWTLAHAHHVFMPSFQGYIATAQRNFIEKMRNPRVWTYWEVQNLWGYGQRDADPIAKANIMYSGYYAYMLAGYLSNTHDDRYDEAGSLAFDHPDGRRYDYDIHRFVAALQENFTSSPYCLFPCEPGWSYTMCNGYAVQSLPVYDRLYGTDLCAEILPSYIRGLDEEFVTLDGRLPMANNARIGLTLYGIPRRTVMFDALTAWQLSPIHAPTARRTYELMREYRIDLRPGEPVGFDLNIFGDGRGIGKLVAQEPVMVYASLLAAAAEMGDTELVQQLKVDIEQRFPATLEQGVKHIAGAGVWSQMFLLLAQLTQEGDHARRISGGMSAETRRGPILAEVSFPDVLVARATSDGNDLDLTITPGRAGGRFDLQINRLKPLRNYTTAGIGHTIQADSGGSATVAVDLDRRTRIHLVPQDY